MLYILATYGLGAHEDPGSNQAEVISRSHSPTNNLFPVIVSPVGPMIFRDNGKRTEFADPVPFETELQLSNGNTILCIKIAQIPLYFALQGCTSWGQCGNMSQGSTEA